MSGDAQPRKRRDKRRRKGQVEARRAEEYAEEREILRQLSTQSEPEEEELYPNLKDTDEIIHVYKDANTGGNIVTKIIFFLLMGGIAVMVGFILMEHRGTTDEDHDFSAKETPWSLQFDDWSKLLTAPDLVPDFLKSEQAGHDHHASQPGGEDVHEEPGHEEDPGLNEPTHDGGDVGWFSFGLPGWGGNGGDAELDQHEAEEPEVTSSWLSMNYFGGDEKVEEPVDDHEEASTSEEVEGSPLSEEEDDQETEAEDEQDMEAEEDRDEESEEDQDLNADDDGEDEANHSEEEFDQEDNVSPLADDEESESPEQFDDEDEQNLSTPEDDEEEPESTVEENDEPISAEGEEDDDPRGSYFPQRSSVEEEDDEAESLEQEEERMRDASEEELFPEAIEALQREASELLRQQKEAEMVAAVVDQLPDEENDADDQPPEGEEETEGMALKFGVGVALVVVAHVVLVKKWNSWVAEGNESHSEGKSSSTQPSHALPSTPSRTPAPTPEPPKSETPSADWAEEAIKAVEVPEVGSTPPRTPTPELEEEEEYEEETDPEEDEEDLSEDVPPINPKIYEELIAKYGQPSPESSDAEASDDGNREYSDGGEVESVGEEESGGELEESEPEEEQRWTNIKKPAEVETGSEGEEEEEEESDDEPPRKPPQGGGRSTSEPTAMDEEELLIRRQLELADDEFNYERYESALNIYRQVLSSKPQDPQALYGVAQVMDKLAEQKKSNTLLQEAIDAYMQLLSLDNIPEAIFLSTAKRAINRLRFRGLHMKAVLIHKKLIDRFSDIVEYRNDLAINYLMVNRLSEAESVFLETLDKWPDDPVARSHYGLVLKLSGKTSESIPHLQRGLAPDHPATRDARLYFHLGDALSRDGKSQEAMKVYKTGVEKGLFRSEYQRSLYNIDHLAARPWWTHKQTTYEEFFKMLETNWKVIRDEGLSAMKLKGLYQDESENLRDVGDWKQFQLFARGNKYVDNCKKTPVTCKIIGDFPPARGCKRGQSKFSVMEGSTHVWPHCGPTNCRLRAHLGLVVPPGPAIRVADDTRKWAEGKVVVFDDSFEHEVWHNGTALRLVLIVDVWHPELTLAERAALSPI